MKKIPGEIKYEEEEEVRLIAENDTESNNSVSTDYNEIASKINADNNRKVEEEEKKKEEEEEERKRREEKRRWIEEIRRRRIERNK